MQDFNEFSKNQTPPKNLIDMVTSLANKFDGKSQNELLRAIYTEAEKGKRNGTLTNADLENFALFLSPMLDEKKKKLLHKVLEELKKI